MQMRFISIEPVKFTEEDVSEFILMGKGLGRALDNYSLYAVAKRIIQGKNNIG